jgi:hypothetical protein
MSPFLSLLFNPGELVRVGNDYKQPRTEICPVEFAEIPANLLSASFDGCFVTLNPVVDGQPALRNLLIEIDENMSPEDQMKFYQGKLLPMSTVTFSGRRSVHVVICLEEALPDLHTYRQYHYAICRALSSKPDFNCDPKKTTKLPGRYRLTARGTAEQKLMYLGKRVNRDFLDTWLKIMGTYKYTQQPPLEAAEYKIPAKLLGYVESQFTKHSGYGYVNCECPSCGGSKMWFGVETGAAGCWHGCSYKSIIDAIRDEFGEGIDPDQLKRERETIQLNHPWEH